MTKKISKPLLVLMSLLLVFTFSLNSASANSNDPDYQEKYDALNKSGFYNPETHKILLSEEKAKSYYDFDDEELKEIKNRLENLTEEEINTILDLNGIDPDELNADVDVDGAHANWVWLIPIAIGMVLAGGIIFSALYFSHKEKMTLINKCYAKGGNPKVSSNDKAGLKGTTKSGDAQKAGGYKFECKKK